MKQFDVQVPPAHYYQNYDTPGRFMSYYYQVNLTEELNPGKILEIGVGNKTVSNYLKQWGFELDTCDLDEKLTPDFVADIRNLPMADNSYDLILACEVLEHLPFSDVPAALAQLHRVTRKYVIISIPYSSGSFEVVLASQLISKIFKKPYLDLLLRIPMFWCDFTFDGQHYWKMGRKNYSLRKIRKTLCEKFKIIKEMRPLLNLYTYFFLLEKI